MPDFTKSVVKEATVAWFEELGYTILYALDIAPEEPRAERASYGQVVPLEPLLDARARIIPTIPVGTLNEAIRKNVHGDTSNLFASNRRFINSSPMVLMYSIAAKTVPLRMIKCGSLISTRLATTTGSR